MKRMTLLAKLALLVLLGSTFTVACGGNNTASNSAAPDNTESANSDSFQFGPPGASGKSDEAGGADWKANRIFAPVGGTHEGKAYFSVKDDLTPVYRVQGFYLPPIESKPFAFSVSETDGNDSYEALTPTISLQTSDGKPVLQPIIEKLRNEAPRKEKTKDLGGPRVLVKRIQVEPSTGTITLEYFLVLPGPSITVTADQKKSFSLDEFGIELARDIVAVIVPRMTVLPQKASEIPTGHVPYELKTPVLGNSWPHKIFGQKYGNAIEEMDSNRSNEVFAVGSQNPNLATTDSESGAEQASPRNEAGFLKKFETGQHSGWQTTLPLPPTALNRPDITATEGSIYVTSLVDAEVFGGAEDDDSAGKVTMLGSYDSQTGEKNWQLKLDVPPQKIGDAQLEPPVGGGHHKHRQLALQNEETLLVTGRVADGRDFVASVSLSSREQKIVRPFPASVTLQHVTTNDNGEVFLTGTRGDSSIFVGKLTDNLEKGWGKTLEYAGEHGLTRGITYHPELDSLLLIGHASKGLKKKENDRANKDLTVQPFVIQFTNSGGLKKIHYLNHNHTRNHIATDISVSKDGKIFVAGSTEEYGYVWKFVQKNETFEIKNWMSVGSGKRDKMQGVATTDEAVYLGGWTEQRTNTDYSGGHDGLVSKLGRPKLLPK